MGRQRCVHTFIKTLLLFGQIGKLSFLFAVCPQWRTKDYTKQHNMLSGYNTSVFVGLGDHLILPVPGKPYAKKSARGNEALSIHDH